MYPIKRQFQPSLDIIDEVLDVEQLSITKPVIREGYIRREVGLISTWKNRVFAFLFVPREKLTCSVYYKDKEQPEQVIDLYACKLTKKCTQVDQKICFGLVTPEKLKYLIGLKSGRDCIKYFYQILSAKSIMKNNLTKTPIVKPLTLHRSQQASKSGIPAQFNESESDLQKIQYKTEQDLQEQEQEEKVTEKVNQYLQKPKGTASPALSAKSLPFKRPEVVIKPEVKEIQKKIHMKHIEQNKMEATDKQAYEQLENLDDFKIIEKFHQGTIYQKNKQYLKIVTEVFFQQSARSIMELFIHLDSWNNKVKEFSILNPVEKGVYRVATHFYKKGCFAKQKQCQSLLSLYKAPQGYFLTMKPLMHLPLSIKQQNWIAYKLSIRIKQTDKSSPKTMIISIESNEDNAILLEFAKEIRIFQQYLKISHELPSKLLEVKSSLDM